MEQKEMNDLAKYIQNMLETALFCIQRNDIQEGCFRMGSASCMLNKFKVELPEGE